MEWQNVTVKLGDLQPWEHNPRTMTKRQAQRLLKSWRELGQFQTIAIGPHGEVYDGHQRLNALLTIHDPSFEIEARQSERELNDDERAALTLAANLPAGAWDWNKLAQWDAGAIAEWGMDAETLATWNSDATNLATMLEADTPTGDADAEPQIDRAAELNEKWQVQRGDLWRIGEHRLLCGDSTAREDIDRLLNGETAQSVVTDPPYGIDFDYNEHDDSRVKWFALMDKVVPIMRSIAPFVVMPCCGIDRMDWWYLHHKPDWLMCWYKGSPGHRSFVGFNDWEAHLVWGKPPSQIHDYFQTRCGFEVDGHPCPKPVEYAAWLVERAAEVNQIIVDFFGGSGTTLVACQNLQRKCRAIEISPNYCAVILQRMQDAFPQIEIERL